MLSILKHITDRIEIKIIEKSDSLLSNDLLKSILIEINPKSHEDQNIVNKLKKYSFKFDEAQVEESRRKEGPHKDYSEYLFYR